MSKVYFQVDWGSFCNPLKEAMLQARFAEDEKALENIIVWRVFRLWSLCVGRLVPATKERKRNENRHTPTFFSLQLVS